MRRIKALPLLIVAAVAAVALAAPATASAVEWGSNGPLQEPSPIEFNGNLKWNIGAGLLQCPVHAAGTLFPGNKGEITEFDVDGGPENPCETSVGSFEHCAVTGTGTVPLSLEAKSTEEVLITKPKNKAGFTDKILWTWSFANKSGYQCPRAGETWKIKADLPVQPVYHFGFLSGLKQFSTVEVLVYQNGTLISKMKIGFEGEWAVTPPGTYYIF